MHRFSSDIDREHWHGYVVAFLGQGTTHPRLSSARTSYGWKRAFARRGIVPLSLRNGNASLIMARPGPANSSGRPPTTARRTTGIASTALRSMTTSGMPTGPRPSPRVCVAGTRSLLWARKRRQTMNKERIELLAATIERAAHDDPELYANQYRIT